MRNYPAWLCCLRLRTCTFWQCKFSTVFCKYLIAPFCVFFKDVYVCTYVFVFCFLYNSSHGNFMNDMYFWVSFAFVAFRSYFMMSSASSIDDAANEIRSTMYEIPTAHWCLEVWEQTNKWTDSILSQNFYNFYFLLLLYFSFLAIYSTEMVWNIFCTINIDFSLKDLMKSLYMICLL